MSDTLPFASGSATSREAAEAAQDSARGIARRIFQFIRDRGELGAIADEAVAHFDHEALPEGQRIKYNTITARMRALKYSNLIVQPPTFPKRLTRKNRNAEVWIVLPSASFEGQYREPPPKSDAAEADILEAAKTYAAAVEQGTNEEIEEASKSLRGAALEAYGKNTLHRLTEGLPEEPFGH